VNAARGGVNAAGSGSSLTLTCRPESPG
jgi:hypothetical protein